ncbi:hypothetical protein BUALT_Bualt06G0098400 [Buddleja alternifolia]|uniref:Reverse transcriptase domain-containing protein n=1 Tax=Buddleja alternifolia TaxID=168488 RepID=A0AAV6XE02_9LAMI|nr:hypothetical protein BUALT_Bualt06G0098400 [Buddleja alternifolia]
MPDVQLLCLSSYSRFIMKPISLCNVLYKIITKTITLRLRDLMDELVSPNQSSFIKGRNTHDNIIVVQEMVHGLRRIKSRRGMLIKIDLEKA